MADDLVDEPPDGHDASFWIQRLGEHLDLVYRQPSSNKQVTSPEQVKAYIVASFPPSARSALTYLPTSLLPSKPLYLLLEGFKTDSKFNNNAASTTSTSPPLSPPQKQRCCWPIADETALHEYGAQVAGTVGELCLSLISHHSRTPITPPSRRAEIAAAAGRMGVALQYVNIARDIGTDTTMGRVYLPRTWLAEEALVPEDVIEVFNTRVDKEEKEGEEDEAAAAARRETKTTTTTRTMTQKKERIQQLRDQKLLRRAFAIYQEARPIMNLLPEEARRPMIVAVESYMEIGRVLLEQGEGGMSPGRAAGGRPTRATVPKMRRLKVALQQLLFA